MLHISDLSFYYQDKPILQNLNLSFASPEIVVIIGDNGAGKTTLLRLIAGELIADEGAVKTRGTVGFLQQSEDLNEQSAEFYNKSGGEQICLKLTKLFRKSPNILLLDEPTNNLDSTNKSWLIEQLHRFRGLTIIVSHDRDFINQVADKIIYLDAAKVQVVAGNYTDFYERQQQIKHEQTLAYDKLQREKRKIQQRLKIARDYVHKTERRSFDKTRDESKLLNNGSRMAAQNNAGRILRATASRLDHLSDVAKPTQRKTYASQLQNNFSHIKTLLEVTDLTKSYDDKPLFREMSFTIHTSERVRISGNNGTGKTTLFKIILGEVVPDFGRIKISPRIEVAYVSQKIADINLQSSFIAQNPDFAQTSIYQAAATMDLTPKEINQPAQLLSRGQLTKLAILKLILRPIDLVILDEITNHLDIRARKNIEHALKTYPGAILMATHDEKFAQEVGFDREISLSS